MATQNKEHIVQDMQEKGKVIENSEPVMTVEKDSLKITEPTEDAAPNAHVGIETSITINSFSFSHLSASP